MKGLGSSKATQAAPSLRQIVEQRQPPPPVVIQAVRSLIAIRDAGAVPMLDEDRDRLGIRSDTASGSMSALAALVTREHVDLLLDLVSHSVPGVRGARCRRWPGSIPTHSSPRWRPRRRPGLDSARGSGQCARHAAVGPEPRPRLTVMLQDSDQKLSPPFSARWRHPRRQVSSVSCSIVWAIRTCRCELPRPTPLPI